MPIITLHTAIYQLQKPILNTRYGSHFWSANLANGIHPVAEAMALPMAARWRRRIPWLVQGGGQGAYFDPPAPTYFP